ncbi:DUF4433 domain-containing protein [Agromyces atrinae]|uniref:DUF4433 domain-containing protein n=1 Tax=Agromyces atrinae TaxID=592376 RepID=A0A4Q2M7W8_9MICO|nr:DUF4433 domain-containing protein [Agromyces atrinae]MCI2957938.1 DUF4433 domain-containing protein [Agromyces atrinae]NYD66758.1 hypothetical protein [Agromyces atrinae]RXZ87417.1 DUF4433 domain-containing protein [Agromyces atrinae]
MGDECIHGFDDGLCAICFPPPEPVKAEPVARVRTTRAPGASSTPRSRPASRTPGAPARPPVRVNDQRLYHVTHIDNLAGILEAGGVLADVSAANAATPAIDVSSSLQREVRRQTIADGRAIAEFVPFHLTPDGSTWAAIRTNEGDSRLTDAAVELSATDFVVLVAAIAGIGDDYVVTDRDAADPDARVSTSEDEARRLLVRLIGDDESDAILEAELLIHEAVPLDSFTVIGVANDKVRDVVRDALRGSGHSLRVVVYPPWFRPVE